MSSSTYQFSTLGAAVLHAGSWSLFVKDQAEDDRRSHRVELDAQIRSGDYFINLATKMDQLSKTTNDETAQASLDAMVSDLIYLQTHYTINKNRLSE